MPILQDAIDDATYEALGWLTLAGTPNDRHVQWELASRFLQRAREIEEAGVQTVANALRVLGGAISMQLTHASHAPFGPMTRMRDGRSMAMEDLGKHDVGLLARAALDAPNPWLRARFADLAITTDGRTPPDWRLGQLAVNSYLEYTLLELACLRTQRNRVRKDGTRFLDVIPPGTPGRLLSEEVRDYLSDMRRRKLKPNTIEKTERTLAILKMVSGDIEVARIDYKHMLRMWELLRWAPSNLASDPTLTAVGRCPHCVGNGFGKEGTKR